MDDYWCKEKFVRSKITAKRHPPPPSFTTEIYLVNNIKCQTPSPPHPLLSKLITDYDSKFYPSTFLSFDFISMWGEKNS